MVGSRGLYHKKSSLDQSQATSSDNIDPNFSDKYTTTGTAGAYHKKYSNDHSQTTTVVHKKPPPPPPGTSSNSNNGYTELQNFAHEHWGTYGNLNADGTVTIDMGGGMNTTLYPKDRPYQRTTTDIIMDGIAKWSMDYIAKPIFGFADKVGKFFNGDYTFYIVAGLAAVAVIMVYK